MNHEPSEGRFFLIAGTILLGLGAYPATGYSIWMHNWLAVGGWSAVIVTVQGLCAALCWIEHHRNEHPKRNI